MSHDDVIRRDSFLLVSSLSLRLSLGSEVYVVVLQEGQATLRTNPKDQNYMQTLSPVL